MYPIKHWAGFFGNIRHPLFLFVFFYWFLYRESKPASHKHKQPKPKQCKVMHSWRFVTITMRWVSMHSKILFCRIVRKIYFMLKKTIHFGNKRSHAYMTIITIQMMIFSIVLNNNWIGQCRQNTHRIIITAKQKWWQWKRNRYYISSHPMVAMV